MSHTVSKEHIFWLHLIYEGVLDWRESVIGGGYGGPKQMSLPRVMLFGVPDARGNKKLLKKIMQARVKVFFHRSGYSPEKVTETLQGEFKGLGNPPPKPTPEEIAVAQEQVDIVVKYIESAT